MSTPRDLIAVLLKHNSSSDKNIALFTPSLIGMFGSAPIFDVFLKEVDSSLATGNIPEPLITRAANLIGTFIPQVAEYNGIKSLDDNQVTAELLEGISPATLAERKQGTVLILSSLIAILKGVIKG